MYLYYAYGAPLRGSRPNSTLYRQSSRLDIVKHIVLYGVITVPYTKTLHLNVAICKVSIFKVSQTNNNKVNIYSGMFATRVEKYDRNTTLLIPDLYEFIFNVYANILV